MPAIKLTTFIGEQPRIMPRLLPDTAAQSAYDVRLDDGALTPIREATFESVATSPSVKTIYKHLGEWLSWTAIVHAAPGPVADDRLYYTGDGPPKVRIDGQVFPLAVPRPTSGLTAAVTGTGNGDVASRAYVYTWVTSFGEESEPSQISNIVDWKPGQTVTLSGFAAAPAGRSITTQRIYRSQTGKSGTYLYFIAERAATAANFVDTIGIDAFQEPLPSATWNAPPDELSGLTVLPNGMMAAFVNRDIYFCEPYRPHAWPEKYALTTDSRIVGLGAIGTSLIVMTEKNPYLIGGSTPDTMQMVKLETNLPCINGRGIVDLGFVIVYPSHEGLVAAGADGSVRLVSGNLFNRDGWLALSPKTMVASQISGRYVAFYSRTDADGTVDSGAIIIDVGQSPFLIRSAENANSTFYDVATGGLFFLRAGESNIYRFDSPEGDRRVLYWRSKQFVLPYPDNFGAILIDADEHLTGEERANEEAARQAVITRNQAKLAAGPVRGEINSAMIGLFPINGDTLEQMPASETTLNVGIYADGELVAQINRTNTTERLPGGFTARRWEIDVSTDAQIEQILIGKTMADIQQTP